MKSTVKVFNTLESICTDKPGGVTELSQRLDINKSSMHRILSVLIRLGYVAKEDQTGRYVPTLKVYELGVIIKNRLGLSGILLPFMEQLCQIIGETINLGLRSGNSVVVVERVHSKKSVQANLVIGDPMPAYCSALGKVFLAMGPDEDLDRYCREVEFKPLTPKTIQSGGDMKKAIAKVRRQGYAIDDRELHEGIRCAAAPVFDESGRVAAALSASGSSVVLTMDRIQEFAPELLRICREASKQLGYVG